MPNLHYSPRNPPPLFHSQRRGPLPSSSGYWVCLDLANYNKVAYLKIHQIYQLLFYALKSPKTSKFSMQNPRLGHPTHLTRFATLPKEFVSPKTFLFINTWTKPQCVRTKYYIVLNANTIVRSLAIWGTIKKCILETGLMLVSIVVMSFLSLETKKGMREINVAWESNVP